MSATHQATPPRQTLPSATNFKSHDRRVLLLQGGGALGAYHVGVYEGAAGAGFAPDWVVGISIGVINAALIAGNPPHERVERLCEFWSRVSSQAPVVLPAGMDFARPAMNRMAAASAMFFGIPGFFRPRFPSPQFAAEGSLEGLSYYDTEPLRATLDELVDFDRINGGDVRLSLGAVNARTGESVYFDSQDHQITANHVMVTGTVVREQPLLSCSACGAPTQTPAHRAFIRERLPEHQAALLDRELCPSCARARVDRPTALIAGSI